MHATEEIRRQAAMQLRETIANDHETMSRTLLQRIYAIVHCRYMSARLHGRGTATAANMAAAFAKLRIARGREHLSKQTLTPR